MIKIFPFPGFHISESRGQAGLIGERSQLLSVFWDVSWLDVSKSGRLQCTWEELPKGQLVRETQAQKVNTGVSFSLSHVLCPIWVFLKGKKMDECSILSTPFIPFLSYIFDSLPLDTPWGGWGWGRKTLLLSFPRSSYTFLKNIITLFLIYSM